MLDELTCISYHKLKKEAKTKIISRNMQEPRIEHSEWSELDYS